MKLAVGLLVAVVLLTLIDRLLLRAEERGWINYRRRGLSRGGAAYHALTMQSIFDPGATDLQKARYEEIIEHDDSGDPPPLHDTGTDLLTPRDPEGEDRESRR